MDNETIRALAELNNRFYRENHESFSQSRHASWPGWERVCTYMPKGENACRVLDVASGNLRFERHLTETFPSAEFTFTCIDACVEFDHDVEGVRFVNRDVIGSLLGDDFGVAGDGGYDAAVSFGFMHHIPSAELRKLFARRLVSMVKPGGIVALSFWQFMNEPKLAQQAVRITEEFQRAHALALEPDDYLLGWNGKQGAYRYCHHFTSAEVDNIALQVSDICEVVDRFSADGRTGALNGYLVLQTK